MKKKNRLLALILAAAMLLALAACGGTPATTAGADPTTKAAAEEPARKTEAPETRAAETEAPETEAPKTEDATVTGPDLGGRKVRYAAWWDMTPVEGESEQNDKWIERTRDEEKKYNFEWDYVNVPWEDYQRTWITTSMAGDAFADVAVVEFNWLYPNLAMNGFIADASKLFNFANDKWNQGRVKMCTFDGAVYGFDQGRDYPVGVLYWNKSMFEREGIEPIYDLFFDGGWTWDVMLDIAKQLTKDTDGDGVTDQWGLSGTHLTQHFIFSNGGCNVDISDPEEPKFGLTSENAIEGYQAVQDFINVHRVVELNPEGAEWDYSRTQFLNGKVGMFVGHWWMVDSIREDMTDEYGIVLFPKGPKMDEYVSANNALNVNAIPATVEKQEDVAFVYDLRTEPLEDEDPDDWRIYYEDRVNDSQSMDVIEMLQDEQLTRLDIISSFSGLVELSWSFNWQIENAEETPQAAIDAIADQAQSLIDTAMRYTPEELVDLLEPDEGE